MTGDLHLLEDCYAVLNGQRTDLPVGGLRLLVLLAVADKAVPRAAAASALWPDHAATRAAGNLRTMLWRLRCAGCDIVESIGPLLQLRAGTVVDIREFVDRARRLIGGQPHAADLEASAWQDTPELLPGCTDEWLELERDRLRLLIQMALRAASQHLTALGRGAEAVESALAAIALDPLSEDAHHALVSAHLAEGNLIEAHRAITAYQKIVRQELGTDPGQEFANLLHEARTDRRRPRHDRTSSRIRPERQLAGHQRQRT